MYKQEARGKRQEARDNAKEVRWGEQGDHRGVMRRKLGSREEIGGDEKVR